MFLKSLCFETDIGLRHTLYRGVKICVWWGVKRNCKLFKHDLDFSSFRNLFIDRDGTYFFQGETSIKRRMKGIK